MLFLIGLLMDFGLTSINFSDNEKSIKFQWIRHVREGISSKVRPHYSRPFLELFA